MNRSAGLPNLRRLCAWAALVLTASGCAAPFMTNYLSGSRRAESEVSDAAVDPELAAHDPKAVALRKANGKDAKTPEEALAGVLDQLEEIRAIDPAAQQQVMADLKAAKPENYALIVEQFQAALAYRQQLAEREQNEKLQVAGRASDAGGSTTPAPHAALRRRDEGVPARFARTSAPEEPASTASPVAAVDVPPLAEGETPAVAELAERRNATVQTASNVQHAGLTTALPTSGDWRTQLDAAIAELQRTVKPRPATIEEMHDHLRLRALQLVAGREQEAYQPIPGASPAQQDYWSKQLFAMAAYLNSSATIDDKQRAAAALVHLDEARSSLAELATLQVRNLEFVARVDGFGAYEPLKAAKFEPGAPVTLYAEVENFASLSNKDGFETRLSTSYQVLDAGGRRIDGAQFPDVSDVCRGRRRDFHLQYGVTLPRRISPGAYTLELTITDQQSGKIGQAGIAFEINAER